MLKTTLKNKVRKENIKKQGVAQDLDSTVCRCNLGANCPLKNRPKHDLREVVITVNSFQEQIPYDSFIHWNSFTNSEHSHYSVCTFGMSGLLIIHSAL